MEGESESTVKLLLENAAAEAHEERCLQENATAAGRFGNRCGAAENATAEALEEDCQQENVLRLVVSGINVALSRCPGLADGT